MRSLSNLYKQWYIQPGTAEARVIDSNPLLASRLAERASRTEAGADGGFVEGLAAPEAGAAEAMENRTDYIALAKTEAARVIEEAKQQAAGLLEQAEIQAKELEERAKQEGYEAAETMIAGEREAFRQELEARFRERSGQLEQEYAAKHDQMEAELLDVILAVFNKVFRVQFDGKREILLALVNRTLMNVGDEKSFRIRVAPDQTAFLEKRRGEILDHVGHDIELDILPDPSLKGNDCMIETDSGVFDCGLDTQLENLTRDIRSLCS